MKSQNNMEIFYYLKQRWYTSKATGEQTTKGLEPIRQIAHGKKWLKLHNLDKKSPCFYTS